jgi:hypothetical protein
MQLAYCNKALYTESYRHDSRAEREKKLTGLKFPLSYFNSSPLGKLLKH